MIFRQFTVLATKVTRPFSIILHDGVSGPLPYATHCQLDDGSKDRWWGHYFNTFEEADADFEKRVMSHIDLYGRK